ncbi:MAG TPA: hypothetical protein VHD90_04175 [Phototrophicaceae bacterium]|nr:hypothetical protein [Phototrophicaceae bacterium]
MSGNAPKILIVVLIMIAVIFFVGIGVGASGGIAGFSIDSLTSQFSGLLPAPALSLSDITDASNCLNTTLRRIVVPAVGSCEFNIAQADATLRALKLKIAPGQTVQIHQTSAPVKEHPDNKLDVTTSLPKDSKDEITLNFFGAGGDLTISGCSAGGNTCQIDIEQ